MNYQMYRVRFFSKFIKGREDECWIWQAGTTTDGYGRIKIEGITRFAHVVSYEIHKGTTNGLCVLHTCDNPPCVNPKHLFLGTNTDNMQDCSRKGRTRSLITNEQVLEIRRLDLLGFSHHQISELFGVTRSCISKIANGKSRRLVCE